MYGELYQYFILHKQLNVPGVGTFLLERNPATGDFPNKKILPATFAISLQQATGSPSKHFFNWLSAALKTSDREAVIRFNDFAFDLKKQLSSGSKIEWNGIGTISKGLGDEFRFDPAETKFVFDSPVKAEKVIREKSEHSVRVGEEQKTSAEMREYFNQPEEKKNYWWAAALAAGILLTIFIGWYFSGHGMKASSTANGQKLMPATPGNTYKSL
jgi:hypothetical protein